MPLKDNSNLVTSIQKHEGFRSTPYWDVNGYAIGYGQHTNPQTGRPVQPGDFIDKSNADSLLSGAIQPYANTVERQLGSDTFNSLSANQQNALVDFAYNYGSLKPDVINAVKQYQTTGDASVVGDALMKRGQTDNGGTLINRRADEANAFVADQGMTGDNKVTYGGASGNPNGGGPNGSPLGGAAAAGGGGGGGGGGCAAGFMGAVGGLVMSGALGGLGLGSVFGGISGALGGGVLGGLAQGAIQGALTSGITGLVSGQGLSGFMNGAIGGAMGQLSGLMQSIPGVGQLSQIGNAVGGLGGGILNSISSIGSNILPGLGNVLSGTLQSGLGNLLSPLTSVLQNPLNIVGVAQQITAAGGLAGFVKQVAGNMTGQFVGNVAGQLIPGTMQNFMSNIGIASAIGGVSRTLTGGMSEAMNLQFGSGPNGLGALIRNMEGLATFGVSSLGNNLPAIGADMVNAGSFDTSNMTRLMQPGNIAAQLINNGLGDSTGLTKILTDNGIPLAGVDDPRYDPAMQLVLSSINSPDIIKSVQQTFGCKIDLSNLGQLTDINHMFPNTAKYLPNSNFQNFGLTMTSLQITQAATFKDIGSAFLKLESTRDLNHISQMTTPFHQPSGELILKTFGYGSGTFGETTMADVIGTAAGYVHEDTYPVIVDNIQFLRSRVEASQYFEGVQFLHDLISGKYTTVTELGGGGGGGPGLAAIPQAKDTVTPEGAVISADQMMTIIQYSMSMQPLGDTPPVLQYTYTVPLNVPGRTDGFLGVFLDDLQGAVDACKSYIETGMLLLKNSTDPDIQTAIQAIDTAHNASIAQVLREAQMLKMHNIDIFYPQTITPLGAYGWAMSMESFSQQTGHGQVSEYLERVATDDIYGDGIRMSLRQSRNARLLQDLGVNVERFNLPSSQYYRDPLGMTKSVYDGNIPTVPVNTQDIYYPTDALQKYLMERDALLARNGYADTVLTPAEKDMHYCDTYWMDSPDFIRQTIGEAAVSAALARNLAVLGNNLELTTLDRNRNVIGTITPDGIQDLDTTTFISGMFDITNKLIYGDIGVTKNDNPFFTPDMIYGLAEMLQDLNGGNFDQLKNTYLGKKVFGIPLLHIGAKMTGNISKAYDTGRDRNDPRAYGGVGPGIDERYPYDNAL